MLRSGRGAGMFSILIGMAVPQLYTLCQSSQNCPLNELILLYVNYTSIKKKQKKSSGFEGTSNPET